MIIEQIENNQVIYDQWHGNYPDDVKSFEAQARVCMGMGTRITCTRDLVVVYSNYCRFITHPQSCQREPIGEFSPSSAARMARYLRSSVATYRVMGTLTYPESYGYEGGKAKRDLKCLLQALKRNSRNLAGWSVFWFMEFQKRGAIHFHFFCTDFIDYKWLGKKWAEVCGSDDPRHRYTGTRVEVLKSGRGGICSYAAKYAAKHIQKVVPHEIGWVGRFWGVCGLRDVVSADTFVSVECSRLNSITRRIKQLEDALETGVFEGKAKMLPLKRNNMCMYAVADDDLMNHINRITYLIQCTINLYYPRSIIFEFPEIYEDGDLCL